MQKKTKITLAEIEKQLKFNGYHELYEYVVKNIEKNKLVPIKNSGLNGKKPALFNSYWKIKEEEDVTELTDELTYRLHTSLSPDYYYKHIDAYKKDREYILKLSDYLKENKSLLGIEETMNERSFEIFGREKFLDDLGGMALLKRLSFEPEKLNFFETSVPMSYYTVNKNTPQNFVIIENNDTFYSMRKHLIEKSGNILGLDIGTLIYGAGKGIYKSFEDYINKVEAYFGDKDNKVYYFGDIDYEGIEIFIRLAKSSRIKGRIEIVPWVQAYEKMVKKAEKTGTENLPDTKAGQKKADCGEFLKCFGDETSKRIIDILNKEKYIPQEIINEHDY